MEPWHGQASSPLLKATVHCWCVQTAEKAAKSPLSRWTSTAGFPESSNLTADPGATSDSLAIAFPPPEACCEELSDALLEALSLLDAVLDALLEDAVLEALPDALPLLPEPPPQAERTDAPTTLTPIAPPSRINCPREIFSFKILSSLPITELLPHRFIRGTMECGCVNPWPRSCVYVQ